MYDCLLFLGIHKVLAQGNAEQGTCSDRRVGSGCIITFQEKRAKIEQQLNPEGIAAIQHPLLKTRTRELRVEGRLLKTKRRASLQLF